MSVLDLQTKCDVLQLRFRRTSPREARSSKTDYSRFIELAAGSLFEVVSQAHIGTRQGYLKEEAFQLLHASAEELSRMLSGLRSYLIKGPA